MDTGEIGTSWSQLSTKCQIQIKEKMLKKQQLKIMKATMTVLTVGFIMQMLSLLLSINSGSILKEEIICTASGSGIHTYYNTSELCSENM